MSYPRVNMLKKAERRYQGAVSRSFMLVSIVVTPILLIALLSGVKLIQYGSVRANLGASHEIWTVLEPRLAIASEQQQGLAINRQALDLINGWRDSQVSIVELMTDIQQVVPMNVQLIRISIRSDVMVSLYREAEALELDYRLALQGVSQGSEAEDAVIALRKSLLMGEHLSEIFDSVKLTSMRKRRGLDGENIREFSLEGLGAESEEVE